MNSKFLIGFLSILVLLVSFLNYNNKKQFNQNLLDLKSQSAKNTEKVYYLKTALNYSLSIDKTILNNIPQKKDIIIYYADQACSICAEDFLKTYMKTPSISEKTIVISDSEAKDGLTITFNDAYNSNYAHIIDSTRYFSEEVFDVLFIFRKGEEVKSILPYSYKEEEKQYFLEFAPKEFKKAIN